MTWSSSINGELGYFLIIVIDSVTNSAPISDALVRLHESGVELVLATLDGPAEHFATKRQLGSTFEMADPKTFSHILV